MLATILPPPRLRSLRDALADVVGKRASMISAAVHARSRQLVTFLDVRMEMLIVVWIAVIVALGVAKVAAARVPAQDAVQFLGMMLPYLVIAAAPIAGYRVAAGSFPRGLLSAQPAIRLCRYGSWRQLDSLTARSNPAFGPTGFVASLLAGILLNVPMRSYEFIVAMPALAPGAPSWAQGLMLLMVLDVAVTGFFYMVCVVMALRAVPLFPRMLLFAWCADLMLQLAIARTAGTWPDLPAQVAEALHMLIWANLQKIAISAIIWLPYLILSKRVNLTFRQRIRA